LELYLIHKILVAVDGSENATKALDFALDLADKYGVGLTILNVSDSPAMGTVQNDQTHLSTESMTLFSKDLTNIHQEILRKAAAYANEVRPNVVLTTKLREGNPALQIVAEAKESGVDLVVVGHRGVGRVKELFGLGGSSDKVAHLAPCNVVIVR
jgi:nucleotide-binding universal stress UspA family protein